ncbi:beta-glucuronidase-like isoform X2 [Limulus polyphemus]|uniref:Beta-glucuronidase n=1 Tax=Limulus polyphemus TaxID=6850 RepID=A0ABM1TNH1_LIMPO|nr:beta-glucuronidase-like isoform X2 [Limulus polyphemus]
MTGDVIPMPVPSSFNDVTQNKTIRDYVGWAWYETQFFIPTSWNADKQRIVLYFGSAHYHACVFLNGIWVVNHTGGHLPFQADVTNNVKFSVKNWLTVALNNTLTHHTIPQGKVIYKDNPEEYPEGFYVQSVNFDFFNYAGIHRSVILYTTPTVYIDDIIVVTKINGTTGIINYTVAVNSAQPSYISPSCYVEVFDMDDDLVAQEKKCQNVINVRNAKFWWPIGIHPQPGYLYTLKVTLLGGNIKDVYYQTVGIRTVEVTDRTFLINGKPFYFMGFGKHEDSNIRGRGVDLPLIVKDFNLIKWIGANSFRTSHYPYAEEIMDQADKQGIVVIDESPAVGLDAFDSVLLTKHLQVMTEMIQRDKNHPSVVMWSVANEPKSSEPEAKNYFKRVVDHTKKLDSSRPVTAALSGPYETDLAGKFMDVIMQNHYFGWYSDPGYTQVIYKQTISVFTKSYEKYKKPIMISEYGADTVVGLHMDPAFIFTEDYQTEYLMEHHKAFDFLRDKGFFIGELIWNFADFMTIQKINRVVGNKKGIFTRERQPKAAAKVLRCRYLHLANQSTLDTNMYCPA